MPDESTSESLTASPSPTSPEAPTSQTKGAEVAAPAESAGTAPTTGRLQFRGLRRQLTEEDLKDSGVQKYLLNDLDRAEAECEQLKTYVERFHEVDKRSAVLEVQLREKSRTLLALEIVYGAGLGLGGVIVTLAPLLWSSQPLGWLSLVIGALVAGGAIAARAVKR